MEEGGWCWSWEKGGQGNYWADGGEPLPPDAMCGQRSGHALRQDRPSPLQRCGATGRHARVGTMLAKDSVRARLDSESGLSFTEFSYQLMQGHDFVHLRRHHGVQVQARVGLVWGFGAAVACTSSRAGYLVRRHPRPSQPSPPSSHTASRLMHKHANPLKNPCPGGWQRPMGQHHGGHRAGSQGAGHGGIWTHRALAAQIGWHQVWQV